MTDDSDSIDSTLPDNQTWNLTTSARNRARQGMQDIALMEPLEISDIDDKFTWMESEGEKLLKSLRHQSDLKYMTFFIQPQFPGKLKNFPLVGLFCTQRFHFKRYL